YDRLPSKIRELHRSAEQAVTSRTRNAEIRGHLTDLRGRCWCRRGLLGLQRTSNSRRNQAQEETPLRDAESHENSSAHKIAGKMGCSGYSRNAAREARASTT